MPYKDKTKNKEYQREYQKRWRKLNKEKWKSIREKAEQKPERKEYIKKWWKESPKAKEIRKRFNESEKGKKYHRGWIANNEDKVKQKQDKYQYTEKGILNQIKKVETRRIKFKKISGVYYNVPNKELVKLVNERDKVCVYCGDNFSEDKNSNKYRSYDHLDPFKKHSKTNTVKCCISCNSSKREKNVWEWLEIKNYTPSEIIYKLSKKDKKNKLLQ